MEHIEQKRQSATSRCYFVGSQTVRHTETLLECGFSVVLCVLVSNFPVRKKKHNMYTT